MIGADDEKLREDIMWIVDLIGNDADSVSNHIVFMADFALWNTINDHVRRRKFTFATKATANTLVMRGAKSLFIQCLAKGDIRFPEDVIEQALFWEDLDKTRRRSKS